METRSTCSVPCGWAWERQIHSIPSILSSLMREYGNILDDESFKTLLTEVECVLDSQLLTTPSSYPRNSDPLTPSHVLTLKSRVFMPPPGGPMFAFEGDGNAFSIFRRSSGRGGERSLYKIYSREWNETPFWRFFFFFFFFFFAHVAFLLFLLFSRTLISSKFCQFFFSQNFPLCYLCLIVMDHFHI